MLVSIPKRPITKENNQDCPIQNPHAPLIFPFYLRQVQSNAITAFISIASR